MATYTGVNFNVVTVFTSPASTTLSTIYSDSGMTTPTSNPFYCYGNYTFYAAAGQYVVGGNFTEMDPRAGLTFANLPTAAETGMLRTVTDSNTAVWGATIAGGGANVVLAFYNGTNWTVAGK